MTFIETVEIVVAVNIATEIVAGVIRSIWK